MVAPLGSSLLFTLHSSSLCSAVLKSSESCVESRRSSMARFLVAIQPPTNELNTVHLVFEARLLIQTVLPHSPVVL